MRAVVSHEKRAVVSHPQKLPYKAFTTSSMTQLRGNFRSPTLFFSGRAWRYALRNPQPSSPLDPKPWTLRVALSLSLPPSLPRALSRSPSLSLPPALSLSLTPALALSPPLPLPRSLALAWGCGAARASTATRRAGAAPLQPVSGLRVKT